MTSATRKTPAAPGRRPPLLSSASGIAGVRPRTLALALAALLPAVAASSAVAAPLHLRPAGDITREYDVFVAVDYDPADNSLNSVDATAGGLAIGGGELSMEGGLLTGRLLDMGYFFREDGQAVIELLYAVTGGTDSGLLGGGTFAGVTLTFDGDALGTLPAGGSASASAFAAAVPEPATWALLVLAAAAAAAAARSRRRRQPVPAVAAAS